MEALGQTTHKRKITVIIEAEFFPEQKRFNLGKTRSLLEPLDQVSTTEGLTLLKEVARHISGHAAQILVGQMELSPVVASMEASTEFARAMKQGFTDGLANLENDEDDISLAQED